MGEVLITDENIKRWKELNILAREHLHRGAIDQFHTLREQNPGWQPIFSGEDFSKADLADADLHHAWFCDANLSGANLKNANCSHANLMGANLQGADCTGTNFRWAHLDQADFTGAKITATTKGLPSHLER